MPESPYSEANRDKLDSIQTLAMIFSRSLFDRQKGEKLYYDLGNSVGVQNLWQAATRQLSFRFFHFVL